MQEEIDLDAFVAEIDAIVRAPFVPEAEVQAERLMRSIDQALGLVPVTRRAPPPAANEDVPAPEIDVVVDLRSLNKASPAARQSENFRPRRSLARDERSAGKSPRYFEEELTAQGRALVRDPSLLQDLPRTPSSALSKDPSHDNENIPSWKDSKALGKFVGMNRAVALNENGTAYAFTLNPGHDAIKRALASRHNGFASWFQKRINAETSKALGYCVPFVFAVDVTRSGRPHLHGVVACNDNELPAVEEALKRAGGTWKATHAQRQVHTCLIWNADGWTAYSARNLAAARKVVGANVIAASSSLKAAGKALHERLRRLARGAA